MPKVRVLIVDDHAVVRQGIRGILRGDAEFLVVGEAADGDSACERAAALQPDVVVMDVSMPGLRAAEATRLLLGAAPHLKVLVLTVHDELPYVRELMRAGAAGYMLKSTAPTEFLRAMHVVAGGGTFLDAALSVARSATREQSDDVSTAVDLSPREVDVAVMAARGYTNAEAATGLGISPKTVETYRARLMTKLGFKTRAQLVRYAIHRGWLDS